MKSKKKKQERRRYKEKEGKGEASNEERIGDTASRPRGKWPCPRSTFSLSKKGRDTRPGVFAPSAHTRAGVAQKAVKLGAQGGTRSWQAPADARYVRLALSSNLPRHCFDFSPSALLTGILFTHDLPSSGVFSLKEKAGAKKRKKRKKKKRR